MTEIKFCGTRGSVPLSGEQYLAYGGATSCMLMRFDDATIMVDCGSGVSNAVKDLEQLDELHLFISHCHSDHIQGFVTLLPLFAKKKLHVYAKSFQGVSIQENIDRLMSQPLWPISHRAYENIYFHELEDTVHIGNVTVTNMDSNHPDGCSLFRFDSPDDSIVTAFDFSHLNGYEEKLLTFAQGCKTLIYDGNMNQEELKKHPTWGHSTPEDGARIGKKLGVKILYITHHGLRTDDELSQWENQLRIQYPFLHFARSGRRKSELLKLVDVSTMLTTERDTDQLLFRLVDATMDITGADGGTLYLYKDNLLEFKVMITRSNGTNKVRRLNPIGVPPVKIDGNNVSATSAREKILINVADCYKDSRYDFSGAHEYDLLNHYRTQSVLVVPMTDDDGTLIGVLQLINATDETGSVIPFSEDYEGIVQAFANQAAMVVVNSIYAEKISDLLFGFVRVMSLGIDERTPYNANHTKNMVGFAERFFDYEKIVDGPYNINAKKRREILMSIWLHDIGKILTPLGIMNKSSRLGDNYAHIKERFSRRDLLLQLSLSKGELSPAEYSKKEKERQEQLAFIEKMDHIGLITDEIQTEIDALAQKTYLELDGSSYPVITEEEHVQLSIKKGTLTKEERSIMENHVVLTQRLLSQLDFPKNYEDVPFYAGNHHEFMNGSGYPNHLNAEQLTWPCRLVTILDIFDALTAKDRPYKKQMSVEKSFSILREMSDEGKLDKALIDEFEQSKAWENAENNIY